MKYFLLVTGISILALTSMTCHAPTEPSSNSADTTSNSFTFQTYTFGAANAGSSYLQDVAVINDTDAWAVGTVYLDSADGAPDPFVYNAVHWDGSKWTLLRIYSYTICGQSDTTSYPMTSVFAFGSNDIWFSDGGEMIQWTGNGYRRDCSTSSLINGKINRIGGTSSSNFYVVGNSGTILHYTSGSWTKITSGTDVNFLDIYGSGSEILAIGLQYSNYSGHIFSIAGNTAQEISSYPIKYGLYGVWFVPKEHYYLVGEGVYEKSSLSDSTWTTLPITGAATTGVRGNGTNDVYVVSSTGDFLHWNGERWESFRAETGLNGGGYSMVGVNRKLVIAVGSTNSGITQAAITVARRN